jgi:hypothetical protein
LVIGVRAATPSSDDLTWSGRRHDDDKPGAVRGSSSADLFDTVFHALHDGEQVAVGFGAPLTAPVDEDQQNLDGAGQEDRAIALLDQTEAGAPGLAGLDRLLGELGKWRPWTAVSTSLPRWRATTSILVWELLPSSNAAGQSDSLTARTPDLDSTAADSGVRRFFELLRTRAEGRADVAAEPVINLAAAVALRAGLPVDSRQLSEPVLSIAAAVRPGE